MAKRVLAMYGTRHGPSDYERLVRVSHWTQEDIDREKRLATRLSNTCSVDELLGIDLMTVGRRVLQFY
jgi:hypothetical protein